jgi:hypothetical protein
MLEWGWDKYLDSKGVLQQTGNTIIEDEWFKTNGTTQLQMLNSIQKKRRDYQGNYDGFFGKVSNFTWNFNPDGSYDISIDLITLGDIIESLKVNTSVKEKFYPDGGLFEEDCFDLAWHRTAMLELLRVSRRQVRLYPAHTGSRPTRLHPFVEPLLAQLPEPWSSHLQSTNYDQGFEGITPMLLLERGRAD